MKILTGDRETNCTALRMSMNILQMWGKRVQTIPKVDTNNENTVALSKRVQFFLAPAHPNEINDVDSFKVT